MRIETCYDNPGLDGRGAVPADRLSRALARPASVSVADVVLVDFPLPRETAVELFCDSIVQFVALSPAPGLPVNEGWDWLVEIAYRPGVTDTLALTAREAMAIAGALPAGGIPRLVQTARLYMAKAPGASLEAVRRAFAPLWNPLIQSAIFLSRADWEKGSRLPDPYPAVSLSDDSDPELFDLPALDDAGLEALSTRRLLALSLPEMRAVKDYFASAETRAARAAEGLSPEATDVELEMIAQTWSEHCKHKIFNAEIEYSEPGSAPRDIRSLFKTYIRSTTEELASSRPDLLSVFTDNAGVFKFDETHAVCVKAETHNSPSALDPYGRAITGIVGVNRDILGTGMGAAPLFNTDVLCFAPPSLPDEEVPEGLKCPESFSRGCTAASSTGATSRAYPWPQGPSSSMRATSASPSCSAARAASCPWS